MACGRFEDAYIRLNKPHTTHTLDWTFAEHTSFYVLEQIQSILNNVKVMKVIFTIYNDKKAYIGLECSVWDFRAYTHDYKIFKWIELRPDGR